MLSSATMTQLSLSNFICQFEVNSNPTPVGWWASSFRFSPSKLIRWTTAIGIAHHNGITISSIHGLHIGWIAGWGAATANIESLHLWAIYPQGGQRSCNPLWFTPSLLISKCWLQMGEMLVGMGHSLEYPFINGSLPIWWLCTSHHPQDSTRFQR